MVIRWSVSRCLRFIDGHPSPSTNRKWMSCRTRHSHNQIKILGRSFPCSRAGRTVVAETDRVSARRDAIDQIDRTTLIVSTHPQQKSGWLRRNSSTRCAGHRQRGAVRVEGCHVRSVSASGMAQADSAWGGLHTRWICAFRGVAVDVLRALAGAGYAAGKATQGRGDFAGACCVSAARHNRTRHRDDLAFADSDRCAERRWLAR